MKIRKPAYFDQFRCLADTCPDSCCQEWDVQVDTQTAEMYRALPGALGDRLRQVLKDDPEYGTVMEIENRRCPMWRSDGLCRIQAELGHDALCKTCREFPRLTHDYGDFVEYGLELSCPEAARLILNFPALPPVEMDIPGSGDAEYDAVDMAILLQTRQQALDLIWREEYSADQMLALLLYCGYHAQALLDGGDPEDFVPGERLAEAKALARPGDPGEFAAFFRGLEILTPRWAERLAAPLPDSEWKDAYRNLAAYFVERYWLQAISDYDLVGRVKLTVISCLMIKFLGGDITATAQVYSKEIENNAENVEALLDAAYGCPAFTDDKLLGLLLL